jgi:hypothetical protein
VRQFGALAVLVLGSACSSHEPSSTRTSPVNLADASTASQNEILFSSGEYDLAPGDEKYLCWAGNLPADRDVIIRQISGDYGAGTHHVFFAWTLVPEPDGMSECPVLFKTTWIPIYLGGRNTSPLQMPDGAGIDMGLGKQLVLQLHLQNTGADPIKDHVTMHMQLGDPGISYTPAGIFGLDNRVISLAPGGNDVHTTMSCKPGKEMHVFSVLGHMHKLGKALQISHDDQVVYQETWNFNEQPITPFEMLVGKDDTVGLDCTHANTLNHVVTYGESSDTEMCATIFYYTPYDHLAGCVNLPQAGDAGLAGDGGDGGLRR